ncbi:MAG: hypothetical protein AAF722_06215 [Cyanobacteria bacterium P01_C01_bin.70]
MTVDLIFGLKADCMVVCQFPKGRMLLFVLRVWLKSSYDAEVIYWQGFGFVYRWLISCGPCNQSGYEEARYSD